MSERGLDHGILQLHLAAEASRGGVGNHHVGARAETFDAADLERARAGGLAEGPDGALRLTAAGEALARDLLRRYRLAERLLSDLLAIRDEDLGEAACGMEHVLSPAVTDAICTLLGHPPVCPHGRPIPPGPCCRGAWSHASPVVVGLLRLEPGASGTIAFVNGRGAEGIDRLAETGLVPGAKVRLMRLSPVPLVEVGGAQIAIEEALAGAIFVRRAG